VKIQSSDVEEGDDFGYSVAISGDYAIVGARYEDTGDTNAGAAYIYSDLAPPLPEPDESHKRIEATGGDWDGAYEYYYFETTASGRYLYGLVEIGTTARLYDSNQWDVEYDPSDGKFYDVGGVALIHGVMMIQGRTYQISLLTPTWKLIIGIIQMTSWTFNSTIRFM